MTAVFVSSLYPRLPAMALAILLAWRRPLLLDSREIASSRALGPELYERVSVIIATFAQHSLDGKTSTRCSGSTSSRRSSFISRLRQRTPSIC